MSEARTVTMLQALHKQGAPVQPRAEWSPEEWYNYVLHQFNVHCMPYRSESAAEAASICYLLRNSRGQTWNTPFRPRRR